MRVLVIEDDVGELDSETGQGTCAALGLLPASPAAATTS